MPFIPHIRLGQTFNRAPIRRGYKTSASEQITNQPLDAKLRHERRLRQERRLKNIKVNFDQRRRNNRRKQMTAEEPDNGNVGLHINTQA